MIKCDKCDKFYEEKNLAFNIGLSKKLEEATKKDKNSSFVSFLFQLNQSLLDKDTFDWCLCNSKEKTIYFNSCTNDLDSEDVEKEKKLGLDFGLNKNIFYIQNSKNFNEVEFLKFLKTLTLDSTDTDFSFNYFNYEKMINLLSNNSNNNLNEYYRNPAFLCFNEIELIKREESKILSNINMILKERLSNNKKIFIISKYSLVELKKHFIETFWDNEHIISTNFLNLMEENFMLKNISVIKNKKNDLVTINTLNITKESKRKKII
jgi:hypothetical protein